MRFSGPSPGPAWMFGRRCRRSRAIRRRHDPDLMAHPRKRANCTSAKAASRRAYCETVRPSHVSKVLYDCPCCRDRRDMTEASLAPGELEGGTPRRGAAPASGAAVDWDAASIGGEDHAADVLRVMVSSLDIFASRIVRDVRDSLAAPPWRSGLPPAARPRPGLPWAAGSPRVPDRNFVAHAGSLRAKSWRNHEPRSAGLTSANRNCSAARLDLRLGQGSPPPRWRPSANPAQRPRGRRRRRGGSALRANPFPYGELPFDLGRLEAARACLAKLQAQGFHGSVEDHEPVGSSVSAQHGRTISHRPARASRPQCDLSAIRSKSPLSGRSGKSRAFGIFDRRRAPAHRVCITRPPSKRTGVLRPSMRIRRASSR